MALSLVGSAVVVIGRHAGQRCGFLAIDAAELGHADDEGDCGAQADARHAEHEVEAPVEIVVGAQGRGDACQLGRAARLEAGVGCDVGLPPTRVYDLPAVTLSRSQALN